MNRVKKQNEQGEEYYIYCDIINATKYNKKIKKLIIVISDNDDVDNPTKLIPIEKNIETKKTTKFVKELLKIISNDDYEKDDVEQYLYDNNYISDEEDMETLQEIYKYWMSEA